MQAMETTIKQEYGELKDIALGKEDFNDMNGTMFGDGAKINSGSPLEDGLLGDPDSCGMCGYVICKQAVILSNLSILFI